MPSLPVPLPTARTQPRPADPARSRPLLAVGGGGAGPARSSAMLPQDVEPGARADIASLLGKRVEQFGEVSQRRRAKQPQGQAPFCIPQRLVGVADATKPLGIAVRRGGADRRQVGGAHRLIVCGLFQAEHSKRVHSFPSSKEKRSLNKFQGNRCRGDLVLRGLRGAFSTRKRGTCCCWRSVAMVRVMSACVGGVSGVSTLPNSNASSACQSGKVS